jgi:hypothetical protein
VEGDSHDSSRHDRDLRNYFCDPLWCCAGTKHAVNFVAVLGTVLHHVSSQLERLIEPANPRAKGLIARREGTAVTEAKVPED